jgi:hypothetical protein
MCWKEIIEAKKRQEKNWQKTASGATTRRRRANPNGVQSIHA